MDPWPNHVKRGGGGGRGYHPLSGAELLNGVQAPPKRQQKRPRRSEALHPRPFTPRWAYPQPPQGRGVPLRAEWALAPPKDPKPSGTLPPKPCASPRGIRSPGPGRPPPPRPCVAFPTSDVVVGTLRTSRVVGMT